MNQINISALTFVLCGSLFITVGLAMIAPKYAFKTGKEAAQYPDGPHPLPILGNIFSFNALKKSPDQELLRIARKYGQMCMLWFGSNPVIIVSSPKLAKDLMDKVYKPDCIAKGNSF